MSSAMPGPPQDPYDPQANPYATPPPPAQPPQYPGAGYPAAPPVHPGAAGMPMRLNNGMGTAALVCGIVGLVCGITYFLWVFAVILGILAIIFGAIGKGKVGRGQANNGGSATAGLVCGIIGMVLPMIYVAAVDAAIDSIF
ncbi:DUF4190 domain-containing protein [Streptomyces violaceusniger]|uniref:Integral membrane protein n=1 Tax=Streptomyces violaceusniger (strain Tu 4113) TaxID=653045 RepID=G2PCD5_STRV4|nr:DUF4190 domain-containing protein [Streptomyces violaceusniger]AEM81735.1 integral membrane protein [Streptomyces violaceusniger Tu 4113]